MDQLTISQVLDQLSLLNQDLNPTKYNSFMKLLTFILLSVYLFSACETKDIRVNPAVLDASQYEQFLSNEQKPSLRTADEKLSFWNARITKDSTSIGDIGPTAEA